MVMTYTCVRKCFFLGGIRNPGDRLVLDSTVGDACPHLMRTPEEGQAEMQAERENSSAEAPAVPKAAGAKAVSKGKRPATGNGSKTQ